jgi:hypothetical protein
MPLLKAVEPVLVVADGSGPDGAPGEELLGWTGGARAAGGELEESRESCSSSSESTIVLPGGIVISVAHDEGPIM